MTPSDQSQYEKMTGTPIPRLIPSLALPTIASMLVTAIYNMADTYFVSYLGKSATGAVGVVFSLMAIIQAVGFTLGMGSGSLISRLLGQQNTEEAERIAVSGFAGALVFGLALTVFGPAFMDPLMHLLGATDTILPYAQDYAGYILYGAPVMAASFVLNNLLRSEGHATLSMTGITTGGILNIALDPIFIFLLDLGISGAAIATLLSQCVSFLILFSCFLIRKSTLRLSLRKVSLRPAAYFSIIQTGLPSFCRQGVYFLPLILLLPRLWGLTGVELAQPAADLLTCATCLPFLIGFFRSLPQEPTEQADS